jgi:hypothetical protein
MLDRGEVEAARGRHGTVGADSTCSSTPPAATCRRPHSSRSNPSSIFRSRA